MAKQQKIPAGKAEEEARLVLEALDRRLNRRAPTAYEKQDSRWLAALKREDELRKFLEVFDGLRTRADADAAKEKEIGDKMNRLRAEYARLGIFQGRRKKEIDAEIEKLRGAEREAEYNARQSRERLLGYASREEVEGDLETVLEVIEELEREKLDTFKSGGYAYSFSSAVAVYSQTPAVAALVDRKLGIAAPYYLAQFGLRDTVTFGCYPQSGDRPEPIEWIVGGKRGQEKERDGLLLVSRYALDCRPYDEGGGTEWKTSSLRKWLNGEFLKRAFTPAQQSLLTGDPDSKVGILDRYGVSLVFALSGTAFHHKEEMPCKATPYAKKMGAWTNADGLCAWWVDERGRIEGSQGMASRYGILVFPAERYTGDPKADWGYGAFSETGAIGVRPAIWLDVSSMEKLEKALR